MSEYKKPIDLTPCTPHLIAVYFADESYTATPCQQKMLCDDLWMRWNNHDRLTQALRQSGCPNAKSSESFGILSVSECCELFQICDCGNSEVLGGLDAKL